MAIEKERKFLLKDDSWRLLDVTAIPYLQGYIHSSVDRTVRVRIAGEKAFLTIKGAPLKDDPESRPEYEYEIPVKDAVEMLDTICVDGKIEKRRYHISHEGSMWEVDEFLGDNTGLFMAEIEFENQASDKISLPSWVGEEVTGDERFTNARLAKEPYSKKV